jgi:signal transduction histidine kinase
MKVPKLKLFTALFCQFGISTLLIGLLIALSFVVQSETSALDFFRDKSKRINHWIDDSDWAETFDHNEIIIAANDIRGAIAVSDGIRHFQTSAEFPSFGDLKVDAVKLGNVYFVDFSRHYYLLIQKDDTWIAIRSHYLDWIIYPDWISRWPMIVLLTLLAINYALLRRWLKPLEDAKQCASALSRGDFDFRILHHSNNELSDLTLALNRMAQDLKTLFEAKRGHLLAISHEIKTPIARARLSLALLPNKEIKFEVEQDLQAMEHVINQLLEIERISLHSSINIQSFWLPTIVNEVLQEVEIKDTVILCGSMPEALVKLDKIRFQLLLRNLALNGIKYSHGNKVFITLEIKKNNLVVKITDTGPGIESRHIEKIFDPFYRITAKEEISTNGTGLGLYLCQRIVQAHGGNLWVTSEFGSGSCFQTELPVINV